MKKKRIHILFLAWLFMGLMYSCKDDVLVNQIAKYQVMQFDTLNPINKELLLNLYRLNSKFNDKNDCDSFWIVNTISSAVHIKRTTYSERYYSFSALMYVSDTKKMGLWIDKKGKVQHLNKSDLDAYDLETEYIKTGKGFEGLKVFDANECLLIMKIKRIKNTFQISGENFINYRKVDKFR